MAGTSPAMTSISERTQDVCALWPSSRYIARFLTVPSMKIPRGRQDADIARVADFLCGIVGVFAPVVIERLDQRGAGRHGGLAAQRVVGKPHQIMRAVEHPLGDQMRHFLGTALNIAFDQYEARAHHLFTELFH